MKWQPGNQEFDQLNNYIPVLRSAMNMNHWEVQLSHKHPKNKQLIAEVSPTRGQHGFTLSIGRAWKHASPGQKRQTLVHEFIHMIMRDQREIVRIVADPMNLPKRAHAVLFLAYKEADELATDDLANLLAPSMPEYPS